MKHGIVDTKLHRLKTIEQHESADFPQQDLFGTQGHIFMYRSNFFFFAFSCQILHTISKYIYG